MNRIRKAAVVAACVASALLCAGAARAQCAFDHSPKANTKLLDASGDEFARLGTAAFAR